MVLEQFQDAGLYPRVSAPVFNQHGGTITNKVLLTMVATNSIYYTLNGRDPREYGTGNHVGKLYNEPLTLYRTTRVKARCLEGSEWSALNEALFVR